MSQNSLFTALDRICDTTNHCDGRPMPWDLEAGRAALSEYKDAKPYETPIEEYNRVLRNLVEAAEALADQEEATLQQSELHGDQKKVTPANMFLSVGRSDIREAIAEARKLLDE